MAAATATLPSHITSSNEKTLSEALAATHITEEDGEDKDGEDLEDGEIREEDEVDDGTVKTVFDDAERFNVKVRLHPFLQLV